MVISSKGEIPKIWGETILLLLLLGIDMRNGNLASHQHQLS
jgi:hypothetical protein